MEETKVEYLKPEQPYINKENLPNLWNERKKKIDSLPERIDFEVVEQTQIAGPRVYINSTDQAYKIIRELSLPNITFISVVKLLDENGKLNYYFRLFADYFGEAELVAKDWIVFVELGGYSGYAYYFVIYVVELGDCFGGHYFSLCFVSFLRYVDFF